MNDAIPIPSDRLVTISSSTLPALLISLGSSNDPLQFVLRCHVLLRRRASSPSALCEPPPHLRYPALHSPAIAARPRCSPAIATHAMPTLNGHRARASLPSEPGWPCLRPPPPVHSPDAAQCRPPPRHARPLRLCLLSCELALC